MGDFRFLEYFSAAVCESRHVLFCGSEFYISCKYQQDSRCPCLQTIHYHTVAFIRKQCRTGYCVAHFFCPQVCQHASINFIHFDLAKMARHNETVMNRIERKTLDAVTRCEYWSTRYLRKCCSLLLSVHFISADEQPTDFLRRR